MQILIGCAKAMAHKDEGKIAADILQKAVARSDRPHSDLHTLPLFLEEAKGHATQMLDFSEAQLQDLLGVSAGLAKSIRKDYLQFLDQGGETPALLAYTGVVFKHLGLEHFSAEELVYAQKRLWITSFLYGLLRPLDGIKPYRMEGRVVLPQNGCTLFAYWKSRLTTVFIRSILEDDGILIDLASSEMRGFFDWKQVEDTVRVVRPEFLVNKGGVTRFLSVYAKKCRGAMCREIIRGHISKPSELLDFQGEACRFAGCDKDENNPVFIIETDGKATY